MTRRLWMETDSRYVGTPIPQKEFDEMAERILKVEKTVYECMMVRDLKEATRQLIQKRDRERLVASSNAILLSILDVLEEIRDCLKGSK